MDLAELRKRLRTAIVGEQNVIEDHVRSVQERGRSFGIEKVFADAFHRSCSDLNLKTELDLATIGLRQHYVGRESGRVDCYIEESKTAFEYKAVRLDRKESSPEFYAGQVLADFARLRNQNVLHRGYVIVFLYGPQVAQAGSPGSLYRKYHNQMFVDCRLASDLEGMRATYGGVLVRDLLWNAPWGVSQPPEWAIAVKSGAIGAVAFSALNEWGS